MSTSRRMVILADGFLDPFSAKTAFGLLRYCPDEVVAVIDTEHASENLGAALDIGVGASMPVVADISEAMPLKPTQLVLGAVFPGGQLPPSWRRTILAALDAGLDVVNGLHQRLNDDPEFASRAAATGATLRDVRVPPPTRHVGSAKARGTRGTRILTIGTDCNIGKRVTALELAKALNARGANAAFVPTGQTGVMITGRGIAIDAVVSDFVSGVVEDAVLEQGDADYIVVEGQGALVHPGFSAVTLGLMHGAVPDRMVLCHAPARRTMRNSDIEVMTCTQMIELSEAMLRPLHPGRVVGIALNCRGLDDEQAARAHEDIQSETGMVVVDPLKTGVGPLVETLLAKQKQ